MTLPSLKQIVGKPGNPNSTNERQSLAAMQTGILHNTAEKNSMAGTGRTKMYMALTNGMPQPTKNDTNVGVLNTFFQGILQSVTLSVSKGSDVLDINSLCDIRTNLFTPQSTGSPVGSSYPPGLKTLNSRSHVFRAKTVIFVENCDHCCKRIKFGIVVMKCQDCRASCHSECKEHVPLPCVSVSNTTVTHKQVEMGTISDYAPSTAPIVHCANEVDLRGLNDVGIYRIFGSEEDVRELKGKFLRGKGVPNLSELDIHLVCGTIKYFLRSFREPLATNSLWHDFVKAVDNRDPRESRVLLYQAVSEMPHPNRDTLSFLIMHLQRVAESPCCKMSVYNLLDRRRQYLPNHIQNKTYNTKRRIRCSGVTFRK
jgi:hypothetical protein